jgi:hypothetical protein
MRRHVLAVGREAVQVMTPDPPHREDLGVVAPSD